MHPGRVGALFSPISCIAVYPAAMLRHSPTQARTTLNCSKQWVIYSGASQCTHTSKTQKWQLRGLHNCPSGRYTRAFARLTWPPRRRAQLVYPLQPLCVRMFGRASAQAQGPFRRRAQPACTLQPLCVRRFGRGRQRCTGWQRCASAACHTGPRGRSSAPMPPPLPAGQDILCIRRLTRPPAPAHTSC